VGCLACHTDCDITGWAADLGNAHQLAFLHVYERGARCSRADQWK
jgi:hypothetical protein